MQTGEGWVYIKLFRGNNTIRESLSLYLQRGKITFERCFLQNLQRNKWNQVCVRWVTSTDRINESGRLHILLSRQNNRVWLIWFKYKTRKNWFTAVSKNIDFRWKQKNTRMLNVLLQVDSNISHSLMISVGSLLDRGWSSCIIYL